MGSDLTNDRASDQDTSVERVRTLFNPPSRYQLSGSGISIAYVPRDVDDLSHLTYQDEKYGLIHFCGEKIRRVEVPDLGSLVSVSLEKIPLIGSSRATFTFLLPHVNLLNPKGFAQSICTKGIITTHRSGGLPSQYYEGQTESYAIVSLNGTASSSGGIIPRG